MLLAKRPADLVAAEAGEMDVQQDERRLAVRSDSQCLLATRRLGDREPCALKHPAYVLTERSVVLDNEDGGGSVRRRTHACGRHCCAFCAFLKQRLGRTPYGGCPSQRSGNRLIRD